MHSSCSRLNSFHSATAPCSTVNLHFRHVLSSCRSTVILSCCPMLQIEFREDCVPVFSIRVPNTEDWNSLHCLSSSSLHKCCRLNLKNLWTLIHPFMNRCMKHLAGIEPLKQIVNLFSSTLPDTKDHFEPCLNHEFCHADDWTLTLDLLIHIHQPDTEDWTFFPLQYRFRPNTKWTSS